MLFAFEMTPRISLSFKLQFPTKVLARLPTFAASSLGNISVHPPPPIQCCL